MSTKIEWCDETWNPVVGCSHASPGCDHCYAERMARRLAHMRDQHYSEVVTYEQGYGGQVVIGGWNGNTVLVDSALDKPFNWRKPRRIFVCSMGDLFHESVQFEWIDQVFAVGALCQQHTFLMLTKRPSRMAEYIDEISANPADRLGVCAYYLTGRNDEAQCQVANSINCCLCEGKNLGWPLKNVWLGVTVEDQKRADERIPILLSIPAAKRFISVEPMLGPINTDYYLAPRGYDCSCGHSVHYSKDPIEEIDLGAEVVPVCEDCNGGATWIGYDHKIDWVICGGENGQGARPMHPDWVRSLRDQCEAAYVPFFFKGWGDNPHQSEYDEPCGMVNASMQAKHNGCVLDGREWKEAPE